jgi:AcrR family transcriptional regulator
MISSALHSDPSKPRRMRRDAQARRERLIIAASELFAGEGYDVSLERVADRAGVGRGTLYRNFVDRQALTIAVIEWHIMKLAREVAEYGDGNDAFFYGIKALAALTVTTRGLERVTTMQTDSPALVELSLRLMEDVLSMPLDRAKAAGLIRQNIGFEDVSLMVLMLSGAGLGNGPDAAGGIERALEMLLRGVAVLSGDDCSEVHALT